MEWLAKGFNIALLLGIVFFFMRRKMKDHFLKQREDLQEKMRAAQSEFEKVRAEYEALESQYKKLDQNVDGLKRQAKEDLQVEAERVRKESIAFAEKLAKDTQLRMDQELMRAKADFQRELVEMALGNARTELASQLSKKDEAWTDQFVSAVSREKGSEKNYAS